MDSALLQSLDPFLEPARLCQAFFVLGAAAVLAVAATPASARGLLTQYGARDSAGSKDDGNEGSEPDSFTRFIGWITSMGKVPHSWFVHFYILSVSSSVFWAAQYLCRGSIMEGMARYQTARGSTSMTVNQVILVWFLMAMQGTRRLYECLFVMRASSSGMWIVHWALGCAYYLCIGISVWIEGSACILESDRWSLHPSLPSANTIIGVPLFLYAWLMQYVCHRHLSELKKYSLPETGLFRYLVCPHYTCECLLYLSLAIIAAPPGQVYNRTLLCGVLFVAINLGVTADGTKKWYASKFGEVKVRGKWKMVPFVY
ncbi:hypothetical protein JX265_009575 [Neoarthrinium moseri]|uniref:Polyprenal reductase n=1 Tax=Neoarthrinium moseri TaxID=1658444 RepID=A0A9P9WGC2_9PEZI|nr:hypothetical protein JX265_009575 [Neoarthrinium moseri]